LFHPLAAFEKTATGFHRGAHRVQQWRLCVGTRFKEGLAESTDFCHEKRIAKTMRQYQVK